MRSSPSPASLKAPVTPDFHLNTDEDHNYELKVAHIMLHNAACPPIQQPTTEVVSNYDVSDTFHRYST